MLDFGKLSADFSNAVEAINEKIKGEKLYQHKLVKVNEFDSVIEKIKVALKELETDTVMDDIDKEIINSVHKLLAELNSEFTCKIAKTEDIEVVDKFDIIEVKVFIENMMKKLPESVITNTVVNAMRG